MTSRAMLCLLYVYWRSSFALRMVCLPEIEKVILTTLPQVALIEPIYQSLEGVCRKKPDEGIEF